MCAKISQNGKKGKDLILEAAFSFFSRPHFEDFSMSQLAAKVGVSKTALYRHFVNKDAVVAGMRNHFYDLLAGRINEIQLNTESGQPCAGSVLFEDLIIFFVENPQYINYFIVQFNEDMNFEENMRHELTVRGCKDEFNEFYKTNSHGNEIRKYSHALYCGFALLFFIKAREGCSKKQHVENTNLFARKLVEFVLKGFEGTFSKESVLYPVEISEKRMKELDQLCRIDEGLLPEENKIFKAFAAVIRKYGMTGVTVERIAGELNMAKSSLYFYFANKSQMIYTLVQKEISLLVTLVNENIAEAKSYSEYQYITMRTETEYFVKRKSILSICGWIMQTSTENSLAAKKDECETNNVWEIKLGDQLKNLQFGFEVTPELLTFLIGMLPVGVMVMGMKHGGNEEQIFEAVKYVFNFMQYGAAN